MELVKTVKNMIECIKPKEYTLVVNNVRRDEANFYIDATISNISNGGDRDIEKIFRIYDGKLAGFLSVITGLKIF